jgi:hypothetical protein
VFEIDLFWPGYHRPGELLTRGSFVRGGPVPVCAQDGRRAEGHRPLTNSGQLARGFQLRLVLSRGRPSASRTCPSFPRGVSLAVRGVLSLDQAVNLAANEILQAKCRVGLLRFSDRPV